MLHSVMRASHARSRTIPITYPSFSTTFGWILKEPARLQAFNTAITKRYPKKTGLTIAKYDDFTDEL